MGNVYVNFLLLICKKHIIRNIQILVRNYYKMGMTKSMDDSLQTFYQSWHEVFSNIIPVCIESTILYHVFSYLYSETGLHIMRHYSYCYLSFKMAGTVIHILLFYPLKTVSIIPPKTY